MLQRLKNAPATFNRVMDHMMRSNVPRRPITLTTYSCIVGRREIESHKLHLDAVMQTLVDAQLYVNLQKCVMGVPEIPALGCKLGAHGVRADPEKVKVVKE